MNFLSQLFGKKSSYPSEYKRFKKALQQNPLDYGLKAQFIKFCLLNRFTKHEVVESHMAEALALFEKIEHERNFDLQCHYLVGKYYQEERNARKAYQIYLDAIKYFNQYVVKNPDLKSENVELAYSIALNLMTLQSNPADPELEKCFKNIRKSYPLHVKRIEMENEMAKPAPDSARIKQLAEEIRKLRTEEGKESSPVPAMVKAAAPEEKPAQAPSLPEEKKDDIFSKLFRVPTLVLEDLKDLRKTEAPALLEKEDSFKLSPLYDNTDHGSTFMVFQNDDWEGPYTLPQLRSLGSLSHGTWVCRVGSQLVTQAYEVPDLHSLIA